MKDPKTTYIPTVEAIQDAACAEVEVVEDPKLLERLKAYDEKLVLKEGFVKKQQLSNLKAHLYKHGKISKACSTTLTKSKGSNF